MIFFRVFELSTPSVFFAVDKFSTLPMSSFVMSKLSTPPMTSFAVSKFSTPSWLSFTISVVSNPPILRATILSFILSFYSSIRLCMSQSLHAFETWLDGELRSTLAPPRDPMDIWLMSALCVASSLHNWSYILIFDRVGALSNFQFCDHIFFLPLHRWLLYIDTMYLEKPIHKKLHYQRCYQVCCDVFFVAAHHQRPPTCARYVFNRSASFSLRSFDINLDKFTQWACRICFDFALLACYVFFSWYHLIFNLHFRVAWNASSMTRPSPPSYSNILSTHFFIFSNIDILCAL